MSALVWGGVYLVWRLGATRVGAQPALFWLLYGVEAFGWSALASFTFLVWRVPVSTRQPVGWRPTVEVVVCAHDEDLEMLGVTLAACGRIAFPHTTSVLGEIGGSEVGRLAERFGARFLPTGDRAQSTAASINRALPLLRGQVLLFVDAGEVPRPDIVDATVGYFDDPSVAVVQTAQDVGTLDIRRIRRSQGTGRHAQDTFFGVVMPGMDHRGAAVWCGSAALLLRHALEGVGGVALGTTAEYFHTSIRLHNEGWQTRYHDEMLVHGLVARDMATSPARQGLRARGGLAVLRTSENPAVAPGLTIRQRAGYLASLVPYAVPLQRLGLLAVAVGMLVSGQAPLHAGPWLLAALWLPWAALHLAASSALRRGSTTRTYDSYEAVVMCGPLVRAAAALVAPSRVGAPPPVWSGVDARGWRAVRQFRLVLGIGVVLASALVVRSLAWAGVLALPRAGALVAVIGSLVCGWALAAIAVALWRVGRRHPERRHRRLPAEIAGVVDGALVRVVDLTPGGAGVIGPMSLAVGSETRLSLGLVSVDGDVRQVEVRFTSRSCRPAPGLGWRMGGTLTPCTEEGGEVLIDYCRAAWVGTSAMHSDRVVGVAEPARALPKGRRMRSERTGDDEAEASPMSARG